MLRYTVNSRYITQKHCGCGGLILLQENYIFHVNEKQIFDRWNHKCIKGRHSVSTIDEYSIV